jgi:transcription initiation factor TFIIA large subunit
VPSNVKPEQQYKNEQYKAESNVSAPAQRPAQPANEPQIKQEPQGIKYEPQQNFQPQQGYGGLNPQFASERANQLLHQQYGSQADASIRAAQARQMQASGNGQRPTHIQMPPRPGQPPYPQQQPPLSAAQTDGANDDDALADWEAAIAERRAVTEQDRASADHQLRDYLERSIALEEGNLLLPASSQLRKSKKSWKLTPSVLDGAASSISKPGRFDGAEDDDAKKHADSDEDAINSELDDTEDELENVDDEDAEGAMGETILCTYDKVQRVKNKARGDRYLVCRNPPHYFTNC